MKKIIHILYIASFLLIIFGMGAISLAKADRETSDFENRTLAQRPAIDKKTLLSGEFSKAFETYFADQLYERDKIIEVYTKEQIFLNRTMINGIIVAKDNWLFNPPAGEKQFKEIDKSLTNLKKLADTFKGTNVEFFFAAAPYKTNTLSELYPPYINMDYSKENQKYFMDNLPANIHGINLYEQFKKSYSLKQLESMYFKTDHHWNIEGAFNGYQKIIQALSENSAQFKGEPVQKNEVKLVCNKNSSFNGSHNRQLYSIVSDEGEKACYYDPFFLKEEGKVSAKTWDGQTLTKIDEIYNTGFTKDPLQYGDIFTWDLPEINFEYENTGNDLHLLVLKDSYGNPIQPFLAQNFNKTSILDIRHYKEKSITQYIKDNHIDIVLFVYNDTNLTGEMYEFFAES